MIPQAPERDKTRNDMKSNLNK